MTRSPAVNASAWAVSGAPATAAATTNASVGIRLKLEDFGIVSFVRIGVRQSCSFRFQLSGDRESVESKLIVLTRNIFVNILFYIGYYSLFRNGIRSSS